MASSGHIIALLVVCLLSFVAGEGALRCWRCSTDVSNGEFCNDPFLPESISEQQRYWSYVNCTYSTSPKSVNVRSMCKKLVQEVYGKRVISRSCFYVDMNDLSSGCDQETTSSFIKTLSCDTCSTDGCNGAAGYAPYVALVLLAVVALLKLLN